MLSSSHFVSNVRDRALGVIFQGIAVYQPNLDELDRVTNQEISPEGEELSEPTSRSLEHTGQLRLIHPILLLILF